MTVGISMAMNGTIVEVPLHGFIKNESIAHKKRRGFIRAFSVSHGFSS
ncbi:hypothetical protein PCH70_47660 [Pseudomonas cichorii JBC1]|nr:hypothetical protein PCH70_47660 [Pseudomonas cichorii JBC1]